MDRADLRSELTLPSHPDAIAFARAYARELATLVGLPATELDAFVDAVTSACADIVQNALTPGETDALRLVGVVTPSALTLAIRERGAPFDPTNTEAAAVESIPPPVRGRDWERIRQAVDEAHWSSLGKDGMELALTKQRPHADVTQHLPASELAHFHEDEPLAPPQTYSIRRLRPEDALAVSQCVYRSYGYSYGNADLYYPQRIVHLNETGQLVSIVAVDEAGAVVGHLALERPDLGPLAESGQAVVAPAHRGRHLLERLRTFAEEEARRIGLAGLVGYPVTTHVFSQRMEESIGAHLCGVALGQMPRSTTFKAIATEPLPQRVSTMLYFKYMASPRPTRVHAPPRHRPVLERLYAKLAVPVEFGVPADPTGPGRVTATLDRSWGYGEIHVHVAGADTTAELRRARRDLCETGGVEVVYLFLPLAQPGTPALCTAAEADAFFWSGVGPCYAADGDMLCLQYLATELDLGLVQVAGPAGRELLDYVAAERDRVRPLMGP
jgi:anti-sigma regulatory factor (Ser/Thr protein kinase)